MTDRISLVQGSQDISTQRKISVDEDLLSSVLRALQVDTSALYIFDLHDPWQIELNDVPVSISWTVIEGDIYVSHAHGDRVHLSRGDTFLLPRGGTSLDHITVTSSDEKVHPAPIRAQDLFTQMQLQGFHPGAPFPHPLYAHWGGQGRMTRIISATFGLNDRRLAPLISALPPVTVVRAADNGKGLIEVLSRFALDTPTFSNPGFTALVTQIAQLLLVHIVRTYALSTGSTLGWLAGLGNPQIARALTSIHQSPSSHWTISVLARIAGMSRSQFATRFHSQVGQTAMQYLRTLRMHLAREALKDSDISISALALDMGYQSEAAFRAAFRQATGKSPQGFRISPP